MPFPVSETLFVISSHRQGRVFKLLKGGQVGETTARERHLKSLRLGIFFRK